jgi:serine/threonine protein kinase
MSRDAQDPSWTDAARLMAGGLDAAAPYASSGPPEVPGLEIGQRLGRGGMGEVYMARQVNLNRRVAVKVLAPELAGDPLFLTRLEREAQIMAQLRHPHIVAIHQFEWLPQGGAALVMEWVEGGNLREVLALHPEGLGAALALEYLRPIAAALAAAHRAGVVHRDLKPENVLLNAAGTPLVADFGLARSLEPGHSSLTQSGLAVGTLEYIAPEQLRGRPVDARADIFALGVVAYEMLTGQMPRGHFDPPHHVRPEIPPALSGAVMKALRADPDQRYPTMEDFAAALEAGAALPRRTGGALWKALVPIISIAAIGAGAFVFLAPQPEAPRPQPVVQAPPAPSLAVPPTPAPEPTREPEPAPAPVILPPPAPVPVQRPEPTPTPAPVRPSADWQSVPLAASADHIVKGTWTRQGNALVSGDTAAILHLPLRPPAAYDLRVRFTRLEGQRSVALFLPFNGGMGSLELDAWDAHLGGLQVIAGRDLRQGGGFPITLENGRAYELEIRVRPAQITVLIDGEQRGAFPLGTESPMVAFPWAWTPTPGESRPALGSYESPTRFENLQWRAVP